jgi:hypothetical protein
MRPRKLLGAVATFRGDGAARAYYADALDVAGGLRYRPELATIRLELGGVALGGRRRGRKGRNSMPPPSTTAPLRQMSSFGWQIPEPVRPLAQHCPTEHAVVMDTLE